MSAKKMIEHCYDFPEIVVHRSDMKCGRYTKGGLCRPLPQPVEPYTDDERLAIEGYEKIMALPRTGGVPEGMVLIKARGRTAPPERPIHD